MLRTLRAVEMEGLDCDVADLYCSSAWAEATEHNLAYVDDDSDLFLAWGHKVNGALAVVSCVSREAGIFRSQVVDQMPNLSRARLSVLPSGAHVKDWPGVLVESSQDATDQSMLKRQSRRDTHILPVSASTLTSPGWISSGLNSLLHSSVPLIRFFASGIFHLAARMNRGWHPGSERKRASQGWYGSDSGRRSVAVYCASERPLGLSAFRLEAL